MAAPPVSARENWINLRTKHFNIVSNADERETRELALKLEQFRFVFSKIYNTQGTSSVPVTVIVFKSDSSFKPFKPLYDGKPANIAGYFQRSGDENIIALNIRGNQLRPLGLIYHEYTHFMTSRTAREWPAWLTEGLAELFSSFEVKKNDVTLGVPLAEHVHFLRESKFLPLQSLFKVGHNSPEYNERDKQGVFYAQSWALLHYLMYGNKSARQPQLLQFVKMLESEADVDRAFSDAFKTDYATMEKELRRYIGNSTYTVVTYTMDSTEGERDVTTRPLAEAEVQFYLGNLLLHTRRIDEGVSFFKQAVALDPSLPGPHEGLGFAAMRRQKYAEAKSHFKEAVARDSRNHLAYYYYAEALHREEEGAGSLSMKPEAVKTITGLLRKAIELMPGFAPSYHLFGYITLVSGEKTDEAVTALRNALKIEPQNKNFALMLAQAQFRLGDYAAARKTLEPLLACDDPQIKDSAQSLVKMIESYTSPAPRVAVPDSTEPARPPRLARRDEPEPAPGPLVKLAGTETMSGVLAALECDGRGIVIAFKTGDKLLRFSVGDPSKLMFYSRNPEQKVNIGCGPINLPAFIHYAPAAAGQARFAGDAVAVEFK